MDGATRLWHIASVECAFINGVAAGSLMLKGRGLPTPKRLLRPLPRMRKANKALDQCAAMSPQDVGRVINFMGVIKSAYSRPMGSKVPAIYGTSADENPFEKEATA